MICRRHKIDYSTSPIDECPACLREERDALKAIITAALRELPVCHIPDHVPESIPGRIQYYIQDLAETTVRAEKAEAEVERMRGLFDSCWVTAVLGLLTFDKWRKENNV